MTIDPYAPCPGGTGKKVKFCCSDLMVELEKVQRMLDGDQRAACLEYIESLEGKFPDRACLMSTKVMLETQLGNEAKAGESLKQFIAKHPTNPVALAESAMFAASNEGGTKAIGLLQDALDKCENPMPLPVYDAIGVMAEALLEENRLISARGHLMLQLGLSGGKDKQPVEVLMRINGMAGLPLWAKQDLPLLPAPDDALWKNAFAQALSPSLRGAWRSAAKNLMELAGQVGDWPQIWHNIAVLRSWLAEGKLASEAWRKCAAGDIPLDDAVEALVMAELVDPESPDTVDVLTLRYAVQDVEALQARLQANPRSPHMPLDLSRMANEGEPPPRAANWLVDRATPADAKNITRDQVPRAVGQTFLFGKQTDRAARLELVAYRPELDQAKAVLADVAGDSLGAVESEEVATQVSSLQHALSWNWRLPDETPPEKRLELMNEERKAILLETWPKLPQKMLGGKSAEEAAKDPALLKNVLASIQLLELSTDQVSSDFDFDQLRTRLGLPALAKIDPAATNIRALPIWRWPRVDVKQLSDDGLLELYRRAQMTRHHHAIRPLAQEILTRPSLEKQVAKDEIHGQLAQVEPNMDKALEHLDLARAAADEAKRSTAPWDLAELGMRIARNEIADVNRLLDHIRAEHIREPGVAQALFQLLADAGIVGPDGKLAQAPAAQQAAGIVVPGAAAGAEPSKIWTPDSETAGGGGKKSALWTPGME